MKITWTDTVARIYDEVRIIGGAALLVCPVFVLPSSLVPSCAVILLIFASEDSTSSMLGRPSGSWHVHSKANLKISSSCCLLEISEVN